MKIAGQRFSNKQKELLSNYFNIRASKYNPKEEYYKGFDLRKKYHRKSLAEIRFSNSIIDGKCKLIKNEFVFINARKLNQEAETFILDKENQINNLRQEIKDYVNEHFLEWELLKVKDAFDFMRKFNENKRAEHWKIIKEVMQEIKESKGNK